MRQYSFAYLVIFCFLLSSCSKDYGTINYKTDSMSLFNADNSGGSPQLSDDTISGTAYAIGMHFGFSFQESYDWDQNESEFYNLLTAKDFSIYALEDFNAIPAGTSLNHLFHYCMYYNASSGLGYAISQENYSAMMSGVPDRNGEFATRSASIWLVSSGVLLRNA